jgi:hypothetical protein
MEGAVHRRAGKKHTKQGARAVSANKKDIAPNFNASQCTESNSTSTLIWSAVKMNSDIGKDAKAISANHKRLNRTQTKRHLGHPGSPNRAKAKHR